MMMGTTEARYPRNFHFSLSLRKAPMALSFVLRPMATSAIIREKPRLTTRMRYTSRKMPPPYRAAR